MILKETLKKHFINFNGGQGLDHWSPSSSQNFTRLVCNYSLPQKLRRTFKIRYKAPFGNLVNNTAQRLLCDVLYQGEKKITLEKILDCLENEKNEIFIEKKIADSARKSVRRMAEIGR